MALSNLGLIQMGGAMLKPGSSLGEGFTAYGEGIKDDAKIKALEAHSLYQQQTAMMQQEKFQAEKAAAAQEAQLWQNFMSLSPRQQEAAVQPKQEASSSTLFQPARPDPGPSGAAPLPPIQSQNGRQPAPMTDRDVKNVTAWAPTVNAGAPAGTSPSQAAGVEPPLQMTQEPSAPAAPTAPAVPAFDTLTRMAQDQANPNAGMQALILARLKQNPEMIKMLMNPQDIQARKVARTVEVAGPNGQPMIVSFDDQGRPVGQAMPKPVERKMEDFGGEKREWNAYTGEMGQGRAKTQSPDSVASNTLGWANHGVAAETARWNRENPTLSVVETETGPHQVPARGGPARPILDKDGKPLASVLKPPTEGQSNAALFAVRAKEADAVLETLAGKGVLHGGMISDTAAALPGIGGGMEALVGITPGLKPSPEQQQVTQAKRNFMTAVLRKESGASIAASEFDTAEKIYFPQRGDSPEVIKQKAATRKAAIAGLEQSGGGAVSRVNDIRQSATPPVLPPAGAPITPGQTGGATGGWSIRPLP